MPCGRKFKHLLIRQLHMHLRAGILACSYNSVFLWIVLLLQTDNIMYLILSALSDIIIMVLLTGFLSLTLLELA